MDTCDNCGATLPDGARFCPNCAAPVPRESDDEPAGPRRRWVSNLVFALLLLLNLAVITFAVLVFGFGLFVQS